MEIDPRFSLPNNEGILKEIAKATQKIVVSTVSRRYGKVITLIQGFDKTADIKSTAKYLKEKLACGGTVKEGVIELQGNHQKQVKPLLIKLGFAEEAITD